MAMLARSIGRSSLLLAIAFRPPAQYCTQRHQIQRNGTTAQTCVFGIFRLYVYR
jgi:hypothetical protein